MRTWETNAEAERRLVMATADGKLRGWGPVEGQLDLFGDARPVETYWAHLGRRDELGDSDGDAA